jgi:hypothetical protein
MLVRGIVKEFGCGRHLVQKEFLVQRLANNVHSKISALPQNLSATKPDPDRSASYILTSLSDRRRFKFNIGEKTELFADSNLNNRSFPGLPHEKTRKMKCDNLIRQFPKTVQFSFEPGAPGDPKNECGNDKFRELGNVSFKGIRETSTKCEFKRVCALVVARESRKRAAAQRINRRRAFWRLRHPTN